MELLQNLPIIIDSIGKYITRDSSIVIIDQVDGKGTFSCKGYLLRKTKTGRFKYVYNIWHCSGKFVALGLNNKDIISKTEV